MDTAKKFAGVLLFLVLAAVAWAVGTEAAQLCRHLDELVRTTDATMKALPELVKSEAEKTRSAAVHEISETRTTLASTVKVADGRLASIQADAKSALETANSHLGEATATVAEIRGDVRPILVSTASITRHADEATTILFRRDALPAQILGTIGAAKVTLGETATTMRDIRRAAPAMIAGIDQVVANSNRTTDATAHVMQNFATATKPLPTWLRVTLGVAPPLAGVAAGAATVYSLR